MRSPEIVTATGWKIVRCKSFAYPPPREKAFSEKSKRKRLRLEVLSNDYRFIFSAAAHAQRAITYLHGLQPKAADVDRAA
jgi:antirestriction protein ArdC